MTVNLVLKKINLKAITLQYKLLVLISDKL